MKGCNHIWIKNEDGTYFCCICEETSTVTPKELLKQTTLPDNNRLRNETMSNNKKEYLIWKIIGSLGGIRYEAVPVGYPPPVKYMGETMFVLCQTTRKGLKIMANDLLALSMKMED